MLTPERIKLMKSWEHSGFNVNAAVRIRASDAALLALGAATVLEVLAYAVPWLDHLLDTLATPAAVFFDLPRAVRWGAAVILSGGSAGAVQAGTVLARLKSSLFTGGAGNIVVAIIEMAAVALLSLLAILAPLLVLIPLALLAWALVRIARRRRSAYARDSPSLRGLVDKQPPPA